MNKKVLMGVFLCFLTIMCCCCSTLQKPEDVFKEYISNWEKGNFLEMYKNITQISKSNITEEEFINIYNNIYETIKARKIIIKPDFSQNLKYDKWGQVHIPFSFKMETIAGEVEFLSGAVLYKEKQDNNSRWYVKWDESMIMPQLNSGDKVSAYEQKAKRGELKDRNGIGMAVNGTAVLIGIIPGGTDEEKEIIKSKLAKALDMSDAEINVNISQQRLNKTDSFVPVCCVSNDSTAKISEIMKIPGVIKQSIGTRVYPYKERTSHLTGYIEAISENELKKFKNEGYSSKDIMGRAGLEQIFEKRLKGEDGGIIFITHQNDDSKVIIAQKQRQDGEDITLTIDVNIQNSVFQQLKNEIGAAVAINPKNGEVLAMASSPAYDPNLFALGISCKQLELINNDTSKPFTNRFAKSYSPGPVFNTITAAIGLKTEAINPNDRVYVSGMKWQLNNSWGDYYVTRAVDSRIPLDLKDALINSDNIYFARAVFKIGGESLLSESRNFGMGEEIPFIFPVKPSELTGSGGFQNEIQLADSGYGQGKVKVSPFHMALMYSAFVNDGNIIIPSIEMRRSGVGIWHEKIISPEIISTILKDLIKDAEVSKGKNGMDKKISIHGISTASEIGTAQFNQSKNDLNYKENKWLIAFDAHSPKILITILIEDIKNNGENYFAEASISKILDQVLK